jgi:hypothetical protein
MELGGEGTIGAVFAMISALFAVMALLVGSAAAGREVHDGLVRIRRGAGTRRTRGSKSTAGRADSNKPPALLTSPRETMRRCR